MKTNSQKDTPRAYEKPQMEVFEIQAEGSILAASDNIIRPSIYVYDEEDEWS